MESVKVLPVPHPPAPSESDDDALASPSPSPTTTTSNLCGRFRTARLRALKEYPQAFSSTYEDEVRFEERDWMKRLVNRDARTFVAVRTGTCHGASGDVYDDDYDDAVKSRGATDTEIDMEILTEHDWIGMIVLLGPRVLAADGSQSTTPWTAFTPYTTLNVPPTLALTETENSELAFLVVSMFVLPEMRGRGVGPKLMQAALECVGREARERARKVNVGLWVEEGNRGAMRCYEKCGFEYSHGDEGLGGFGAMGKSVGMVRVIETELGQSVISDTDK